MIARASNVNYIKAEQQHPTNTCVSCKRNKRTQILKLSTCRTQQSEQHNIRTHRSYAFTIALGSLSRIQKQVQTAIDLFILLLGRYRQQKALC